MLNLNVLKEKLNKMSEKEIDEIRPMRLRKRDGTGPGKGKPTGRGRGGAGRGKGRGQGRRRRDGSCILEVLEEKD